MTPRKGNDAGFARDVSQILTGAEVGIRWADNVGPLATFRYLASRAPIRVRVSASGCLVLFVSSRHRLTPAGPRGSRRTRPLR